MKDNPLLHSDEQAFRVAYLIAGYIRKTLTTSEHDELDEWVEQSDQNMLLFEELTDPVSIEANLAWMDNIRIDKALEKTKQGLQFTQPGPKKKKKNQWFLVAAACILLIAVSAYFLFSAKTSRSSEALEAASPDVSPGTNKATLILSSGKMVNLDEKSTGIISNETATRIEKTGNGQLMYQKQAQSGQLLFNTLSTPRGGQYALTLSDGTKVWLNALSSLKYPEQFTGSARIVEINGEAFFEVAKDKNRPFIVKFSEQEQLKVLGTVFNALSYHDEETKTITLIEGSVQVSSKKENLLLSPGQQAKIKAGTLLLEKNADTEAASGWKNGEFVFRDADIYGIMRQAERWYDINVIYKTTTSEHFNFSVSRKEPLSRILHLVELTGKIHFKIENNNVYVLP